MLISSGIDKVICSPPCIKVAEDAMIPLTVINSFFNTFFKADLVKAATKTPTPYSCRRIGVGMLGTICVSVVVIRLLFY